MAREVRSKCKKYLRPYCGLLTSSPQHTHNHDHLVLRRNRGQHITFPCVASVYVQGSHPSMSAKSLYAAQGDLFRRFCRALLYVSFSHCERRIPRISLLLHSRPCLAHLIRPRFQRIRDTDYKIGMAYNLPCREIFNPRQNYGWRLEFDLHNFAEV